MPSATAQSATESRMFCPVIGMPEDPVSGNAHGMLGVYLLHHGLLTTGREGVARFTGHQGRFVERPGIVEVGSERVGQTRHRRPRQRRRRDRLRGRTADLTA